MTCKKVTEKMDHKKKPWKNLNNFSKAITKFFTGFISFSFTPSSPTMSTEPKPSLYECPCGYHSRKREEHRQKMKSTEHGEGLREGNNGTGIFLVTEYEYKDYKEEEHGESGLSIDDAYALVSRRSRDGAAAVKELEDVDERAEKFITEFREQLRIQRLLSGKEYI